MQYLLGVDIGTTAVKAMIIDAYGHVMVKSTIPYELHFPQPGWAEQNPEAMGRGKTSISEALGNFCGDRAQIKALTRRREIRWSVRIPLGSPYDRRLLGWTAAVWRNVRTETRNRRRTGL